MRTVRAGIVFVLALAGAVAWAAEPAGERSVATFAGGCFWCMEPPFDVIDGVISTTAGYTGGTVPEPTYKQVTGGRTGHAEAVQVVYDPRRVSYAELLRVFWHNIDPTTADRQFCDRGSQYRSAIFYHDEQQQRLALESRARLEHDAALPGPILTEITAAGRFWRAEDWHQDYYRKNPLRYQLYRRGCGRDERLRQIWGEHAPGH